MTNIVSEIKKDEEWLTVELNPTRDMLQSLAAKIYSMPQMNKIFVNAKLDFSAFGLGVSIENAAPVTDIENVLELMLENIKKHNKRLLISVDEVTNCEFVKVFVSSFQIFLRQDYPIFLLMTGLFENIYDLQNDKALTFLYRAPKIMLEPLSFTAVRNTIWIFLNWIKERQTKWQLLQRDILLHSRYWDIFTGKTGMITR